MKKRVFSCLLMVLMIFSMFHINIFAQETINNNEHNATTLGNLTRLTPEYVQSLIDELKNQETPSPRLTENDILYERDIFTTDNSTLKALTLRPLTQDEVLACYEEIYGYCQYMTILCENEEDRVPTSSYNCHYYAWCRDWCDEEYWIYRAEPIANDVHTYTFTDDDYVQIGDIVTYWVNGECKHSAIVYSFINGQIFCKSKWGENGLFIHPIDDVPPNYKSNGQKNVKFHRYDHGNHFWGWNKVSETQHEWKCNRCAATNNARAPHNFYISESYNSTSHRIQCYDCGYGYYEDHDLYLHTAEPGDYVVKCRDCSYTIECSEDPEFIDGDETGHWVDCTCGCYSFFEEHSYNYHWFPPSNSNRLFYHRAVCSVCTGTRNLPHNWVSIGGGVVCSDCGLESEFGGAEGIMNLSDEEISLLLSSMSVEELEQFIASLPEDAVARVTAILPPDDDDEVSTK